MIIRHGILGATALVFAGAVWLWAKNGSAILLDLSWVGCF
jgi:hypothetical protein